MASDRDEQRYQRPPGFRSGDVGAHVESIVRAAEREALAVERAIEQRRRSAEEEIDRYLAAARLRVDAEAAARAARLESLSGAARRLADELSDAAGLLNEELQRGEDDLSAALPRIPWPSDTRASYTAPHDPFASPRGATARDPYAGEPFAERDPRAREAFDADHRARDPFPADPFDARSDAEAFAERPHAREPEPAAPRPSWSRAAAESPAAAPEAEPAPAPLRVAEPPAPQPEPAPSGEMTNAARLVAIEMAVGGASRADVDEHLRSRFGVDDPSPLLDDVFGAESHPASRLAWGEP